MLPAVVNYFTDLLKATTLLAGIGVGEVAYVAYMSGSASFRYLEPLTGVAILFFLLIFPLSVLARHLNANQSPQCEDDPMTSNSPVYLPFDAVWKMRVDHPYSLLVRDGSLLWSCGQCPLDGQGNVLYPGDLMAQATSVAGFIRRFLGSMHSQAASVGRLVVYYVKTAADDASRLRSLFLQEFGTAVQIVPVAIPHFYYEGMLIEVDVFASDARLDLRTFCDAQSGITFDVTDAGQFFWATLTIPRSFDRAAKSIIDSLLARANFLPERVLTEQWFVLGQS